MAYGSKYLFTFKSTNGVVTSIDVRKDGYSGTVYKRAIGRAPILKMQKNGAICGTSLEFFAECQVDGEFAEFYTTNAREFLVVVTRGGSEIWRGFITPELYSEPDIAPPYDVDVVATDGLGELKLYNFEALGKQYIGYILTTLLSKTGLSLTKKHISSLSSEGHVAPAAFISELSMNIDYMAGKTCYEVLQYLLDTLGCTLMMFRGSWLLTRIVDVAGCLEDDALSYIETSQEEWDEYAEAVKTVGQMGVADMWPVGHTSTRISPAKKKVTVQSPWYMLNIVQNPDMASDTTWVKSAVTYNSTAKRYELQSIMINSPEIYQDISGYYSKFSSRINWHVASPLSYGMARRIYYAYTTSYGGKEYTLVKNSDGEMEWQEGYYNTIGSAAYIDSDVPASVADRSAVTVLTDEIPALLVDSNGAPSANGDPISGGLRIILRVRTNKFRTLYLYHADAEVVTGTGYRDVININNNARGEDSEVEIAGGRITNEIAPVSSFMAGIFRDGNTAVRFFEDAFRTTEYTYSFLEVAAWARALEKALPRLELKGRLNVPASFTTLPPILQKGSGANAVNYWIETYEWDLLNDEVSIVALSLPSASMTVTSETIEPAVIIQ